MPTLSTDPPFQSFFIGGFECSTHRRPDGPHRDLIAATAHDRFCQADYARLQALGIRTARDGIRWHLIEPAPGRYDFSSVLPMIRAAQATGTQVIWDLWHYGWPDDLNLFAPAFVERFAGLARAFSRLLDSETDQVPILAPINEISFFAWAAGDAGFFHPFTHGRGLEIKFQLVRATLAAIRAIWEVNPRSRIALIDPVINVIPDPARPWDAPAAEAHRQAQYQTWDMVAGHAYPDLGGHERYLDLIGVNYYSDNQWIMNGPHLTPGHPLSRPFHTMLQEVYARYGRPLFIGETGAEGAARSAWLRYMGAEVRVAQRAGVPVEGLCLYPILDYPGWDDDRHCPTGLWGYPTPTGDRPLYRPLAAELARQQRAFAGNRAPAALPIER
jgi:beta-glucosidase/6-phospho-beta-glucosidase/beta-galactosidase